jgi:FKBP-type peptidyl-prolyl cis-trans isomerase
LGFESLPRSLNVRAKLLSLMLALLLGAGIAACGGDDTSSDSETAATPAPTETATPQAANIDAIVKGITKNTKKKPAIVKPEGDPPSSLVTKDIVKGTGRKAKAGDRLTMQYVGVTYADGNEFDSSWDRGQPFKFQLGKGSVIKGWDQGLAGIKPGGRRELIIPSKLAYGAQGKPPSIPPNAALVFIVDALSVGK